MVRTKLTTPVKKHRITDDPRSHTMLYYGILYLGGGVMLLQGCQVTGGVYPAVARRRV